MVIHFWGRCQSRIGSPLGLLAAALLGLSLLFLSPAVSADSTPYPAKLDYQGNFGINTTPSSPILPTIEQACEWVVGHWQDTSSPFFTYDYPPGRGYAGGICFASQYGRGPIVFGLWKRYTECFNGGQVDDATVANPMCSCPVGWMFPPGGLVYGGPPCVPNPCPVDDLPDFPPTGDLCSASLEAGNGKDVSNACPAASVLSDSKGEPCLKQKLGVLGIPYTGPTSTIRTAAYQKHLGEVFDKYWQHQWLITDPVAYQACTAKRAIVEGEMSKHRIDYAPAPSGSLHNDGKAFDISRGTIDTLRRALAQAGRNVSGLLSEPPACNLGWGGDYRNPDYVHFETP